MFGPTEFGVRFFSPLLGFCTSLLVYLLGRKLSREKVAFWSVVGLNLLPLFNVESVLMTVDSLSLFFWAAALYLFWLAIERSPRFSIFWPVTGVVIGLGFLCKYENALELVSILLFLLVVPKYRSELRRPNFYLLLLCFAPVPGTADPLECSTRLARVGPTDQPGNSKCAVDDPVFALERILRSSARALIRHCS